jgi:hypothetical protein
MVLVPYIVALSHSEQQQSSHQSHQTRRGGRRKVLVPDSDKCDCDCVTVINFRFPRILVNRVNRLNTQLTQQSMGVGSSGEKLSRLKKRAVTQKVTKYLWRTIKGTARKLIG